MASAIVGDLSMYQGEDETFIDKIYQADGTTPQDITSWGASFVLHAAGDPGTVFLSKTITGGGIAPSNPTSTPPVTYNWAFTTPILRADTLALLPGGYGYRWERTDAANDTVVTVGLFTILP